MTLTLEDRMKKAREFRWPSRRLPNILKHDTLISPREAAWLLGVNEGRIYGLLDAKEFGERLPNGWVVLAGDLERYRRRAIQHNQSKERRGPKRIVPAWPICKLPDEG